MARSLPIEWSLIRGSTQVGSNLAHKYHTRVEVNVSSEHTSLLQNGNNYDCKKFRVQVLGSNPIKLFTAVNYGFS